MKRPVLLDFGTV